MTFEQFKKMCYHTRSYVRIPGSGTVIDKTKFVTKKGFDNERLYGVLREVYDAENYKDR